MLDLQKPYFRITYEDEFQTVTKVMKEPVNVKIHEPVQLIVDVLLAAGWAEETIKQGFENYTKSLGVSDYQLSFDFDKGIN
jgi:hypothetical protein